jgi:hypothetical protein
MKHKDIVIMVVVILLGLYGVKALIHPGFFTSHDGWHIVTRLYYFNQAITAGQFPPHWSTFLMNGFGYPLFFFSYHLPWWMAEPLVLIGVSIFDAIKTLFIVTFIASGLTFYFWIKEMWGRMSAFAGTFIYLFTSYRFATIFIRANMGEAVSFLFFPFIFSGLYRIWKRDNRWGLILLTVGIAGSLLSHIMVVFLFALPVFLYFLSLFFSSSEKRPQLVKTLISVILAIGLDFYYLLPAVIYKPQTIFTDVFKNLYQGYFTPFSKLIYSPWGVNAVGLPGEMSRQVGVAVWMSVGLSVMVTVLVFIKNIRNIRKISFTNFLALGFILNFIFALVMMQKISLPIWNFFAPLALVDFPFRFLAVTTFLGAALASYVVYILKGRLKPGLIILIGIVCLYTNRNYLRVNQYTDIPLSLYVSSELSTNTDDEYLPKWVNRQYARRENKPLITSPLITVINSRQNATAIELTYTSDIVRIASLRQMYFPGIVAQIDQKNVDIHTDGNGAVELNFPSGKHNVTVSYQTTKFIQIGEIISMGALIIFLSFVVVTVKKTKHV